MMRCCETACGVVALAVRLWADPRIGEWQRVRLPSFPVRHGEHRRARPLQPNGEKGGGDASLEDPSPLGNSWFVPSDAQIILKSVLASQQEFAAPFLAASQSIA